MPTPSRFSPRVEFSDRTLLRRVSPARQEPTRVHHGLLYADGSLHQGGKLRTGTPRDHQVIAPARVQKHEVVCEPLKETANGKYMFLGKRLSSPAREVETPTQRTVFGRKHVAPPPAQEVEYRCQKNHEHTPRDSFIPGLAETQPAVDHNQGPKTHVRKHMDGPPTFEVPSFDKRPYTPQLRRVPTRNPDNDIFLTRSTTPGRSGSLTPTRSRASVSSSYNIITGQPVIQRSL